MTPKLIGITGKARSGKDTVGNILKYNAGFARVAFADPIKEAVNIMFGLNTFIMEGPEKEQDIDWLGRSPRFLMQTLGTEWGRQVVDKDLWLKIAMKKINNLLDVNRSVVVTDVRFDNEADLIRSKGGTIIHLQRKAADTAIVESNHKSESGVTVLEKDWIVYNDYTLADLRAEILDLIESQV